MKLITLILLIATSALADSYCVVFIMDTMPEVGLTKVLDNIKEMGDDAHAINSTNMPVWYQKSDTNVTGKVCCIRIDGLGVRRWRNETITQARQDIKDGLKVVNKSKVVIKNKPMFIEAYGHNETPIGE